MKRTCESCRWFVEETGINWDYSHKEAKRLGKGFCLVQNLFTNRESGDKACKEYLEESEHDK